MVKVSITNKAVIVFEGRNACSKAEIVKNFDGGTRDRHCLVAGKKKSRVKCFVELVNYRRLMPTRYTMKLLSDRPHRHCLVAGIKKYPAAAKVTPKDSTKTEKKSRVKCFVKLVNYRRLIPTRYTMKLLSDCPYRHCLVVGRHCLVAGVKKYPAKKTEEKSGVKCFVKLVNYRRLMPTCYTMKLLLSDRPYLHCLVGIKKSPAAKVTSNYSRKKKSCVKCFVKLVNRRLMPTHYTMKLLSDHPYRHRFVARIKKYPAAKVTPKSSRKKTEKKSSVKCHLMPTRYTLDVDFTCLQAILLVCKLLFFRQNKCSGGVLSLPSSSGGSGGSGAGPSGGGGAGPGVKYCSYVVFQSIYAIAQQFTLTKSYDDTRRLLPMDDFSIHGKWDAYLHNGVEEPLNYPRTGYPVFNVKLVNWDYVLRDRLKTYMPCLCTHITHERFLCNEFWKHANYAETPAGYFTDCIDLRLGHDLRTIFQTGGIEFGREYPASRYLEVLAEHHSGRRLFKLESRVISTSRILYQLHLKIGSDGKPAEVPYCSQYVGDTDASTLIFYGPPV